MIYVDSNIPMYLVGKDHPNKTKVIEVVSRLVEARETLVTSAEVFQEIIHRYKAINDLKSMNHAYEALENMVSLIFDVTKDDVDQTCRFVSQYKKLSSRDALHVAIIKRIKSSRIWTFDTAFDVVTGIQRIQ